MTALALLKIGALTLLLILVDDRRCLFYAFAYQCTSVPVRLHVSDSGTTLDRCQTAHTIDVNCLVAVLCCTCVPVYVLCTCVGLCIVEGCVLKCVQLCIGADSSDSIEIEIEKPSRTFFHRLHEHFNWYQVGISPLASREGSLDLPGPLRWLKLNT